MIVSRFANSVQSDYRVAFSNLFADKVSASLWIDDYNFTGLELFSFHCFCKFIVSCEW